MPTYDFVCEVCGTPGRAWWEEGHPRFCSIKCKSLGRVNYKKGKWPISPEMHKEIKRLYQTRVGMSKDHPVKAYAEKIGYPRWKITRYAMTQGWVARQKKARGWSEKELRILQQSAHRHPEVIQRHLKRTGFNRTVVAIVQKRKRQRCLKNIGGQSAYQLAQCFGIDSHTITRWIRLGYLKANKRGTERTSKQGGDTYFIRDKWVRDFILEYIAEIDIRKVDKFWFVDLLAGGQNGLGPLSVVTQAKEDQDEPY